MPGQVENTGEVGQTGGSPVGDTIRDLTSSVCTGQWKTPRSCSIENRTCEYSVQWQYMHRKDEIRFTITTSHTDTWTGIGFSNNEKMVRATLCYNTISRNSQILFIQFILVRFKKYNK